MGAFQLFVRRDPGYELRVSVKFTVMEGAGIVSLPQRGSPDPSPMQTYEESDIGADALRGGRFIHLLPDNGKRQSYALSRLTTDKIARLPESDWVELDASTEFGFRYAVLPDNLPSASAPAGVAVAVAAPSGGASAAATPPPPKKDKGPTKRPLGVKRPTPVASVSSMTPAEPPPDFGGGHTPAEGTSLSAAADPGMINRTGSAAATYMPPAEPDLSGVPMPRRPVPVETTLAQAALAALTREELAAKLQKEMEKVSALHLHLDSLERKLALSRSRERDLLGLLQKWQATES